MDLATVEYATNAEMWRTHDILIGIKRAMRAHSTRCLAPGSWQELVVKFLPSERERFVEFLKLQEQMADLSDSIMTTIDKEILALLLNKRDP